jgi:threonine-phosphate decarboxylase
MTITHIRKSFARAEICQHGGRSREMKRAFGDGFADFSASINPMGSPPLLDIATKELSEIGNYPDNSYREFRDAAAAFVGVSENNIVPGNGSTEIIRLFAETLLDEGKRALIPSPTFGEYEGQSKLFGAEIVKSDLGIRSSRDLDDVFSSEILKDCDAAFFCNPNNPTGILTSRKDVAKIAGRCTHHEVALLVDEAFIELSDPGQSVADIAPTSEFLVVMRSLTKSFGIPGLRLGFGVMNEDLAGIMNRARIPWSISGMGEAAAVHLLGLKGYLEESRELIKREREWMAEGLMSLGLTPLKSDVNFIMVGLEGCGCTSPELAEKMMDQRILIRDCSSFGVGDRYIRLAVRRHEENLQLIDALRSALG